MAPAPDPLDPSSPSSGLPSPPTSPTSPRTAARIRIKSPRRPVSLVTVSPTASAKGHGERTRSVSPSLSRIVAAEPDASNSESRMIALVSTSVNTVAGKRRQSSIAYYTPSSPSPWSQRPQLNRTLSSSADGPRDGEPLVSNGKENVSQRSSLILSPRSPSTRESVSSDGAGTKERAALTLVEKHADLLHFIAQKERKCLELRDQLAAHEKELAELKRKWERIVNRGHDHGPVANVPLTASLGGVAFDGLKEGVRMIAAGFGDLSGVIPEFEPGNNSTLISPTPLAQREISNDASSGSLRRRQSEHLSTSSMSSVFESVHMHAPERVHGGGGGEVVAMTVATAPSLSRTGSLNHRVHKRTSRSISKEPATPSSTVASSPRQNSELIHLDEAMSMSLMLPASLTLAPPFSSATPKLPVMRHASAGPVSSWMDNMGKKLSELQKGQTFSKSQKRASSLLAGVSSTISSALTPGPTATTPAPYPTSISTFTPMTKTHPSTHPPPPPQRPRPRQPPSDPYAHPHSQLHPPSKTALEWDWLDDDEERREEKTVHAGRNVLIPDSKSPPPACSLGANRTTDEREHREVAAPAATSAASYEDEEWNW